MPTGYTAKIKDGISFEEFVLGCARAFGVCITMRDDPADKEIPEEFKPEPYHKESISKAEAELFVLQTLVKDHLIEEYEKEYQADLDRYKEYVDDNINQQRKYKEMLARVEKWQPPSDDHVELKKFMIRQIQTSIAHDDYLPDPPRRQDPKEWYAKKLETQRKALSYRKEAYEKQVELCKSRTEWVQALRRSLK